MRLLTALTTLAVMVLAACGSEPITGRSDMVERCGNGEDLQPDTTNDNRDPSLQADHFPHILTCED